MTDAEKLPYVAIATVQGIETQQAWSIVDRHSFTGDVRADADAVYAAATRQAWPRP
ncbi:hypothetical protein OG579_08480 [Williamsia herbipolensis]|uniref:Uncharacterized protein n=1 Tax=Williamsia herbipolensis TaxID=1603258 RepID=A0AAU4K6X1_9NOCA|nr:hypothetical protein [Williamsia herbipolensis]